MSIEVGSKVKFIGSNAHPQEVAEGNRLLKTGVEYTVNYIHIPNPFYVFIFLDGFPGDGFNFSMFELVEAPVTECLSH